MSIDSYDLDELRDLTDARQLDAPALAGSPMLIVDPNDVALTVVAMPCRGR